MDLISRQAAIDCVTVGAKPTTIRGRIAELPSAQPEQRWIPVSERLPDDLQEVNVTWINRNPASYYADIKDKPFTATAVYYGGCWYWYSSCCRDYLAEYGKNEGDRVEDGIVITAWQPLPEPYEGERKEWNLF